jgi:ATP-dependent DNA helicase DinG
MSHIPPSHTLASLATDSEEKDALSLNDCMNIASHDYQLLAQSIIGFAKRSGQQQIIQSSVQAIFRGDALVSQAGTGIGKTFSYLVACMPFLREQGKHLIVSTHTVALQTQLIEKDLPFVVKLLAPELKFEVAKGSNRYFCPKRALDLLSKTEKTAEQDNTEGKNGELFDLDKAHQDVTEQSMLLVKQIYQDFEQGSFNGDIDTLMYANPEHVAYLVNRDYLRCPGQKRCPMSDNCPFYQQREKIKQADIVVTNHALLSQTALHGATVLGDLKDSILVLDEAHHFADVLRDSHENTLRQSNGEQLFKQAKQLGKLVANILKNHPKLSADIDQSAFTRQLAKLAERADTCGQLLQESCDHIKVNFAQLRGELKSSFDDPSIWVLGLEPLHGVLKNQLASLFTHYSQLEKQNNDILAQFGASLDRYSAQLNNQQKRVFNEWQTLASRLNTECNNAKHCLERYVNFNQYMDRASRARAGLARWISLDEANNDVVLHSNHVNIGEKFQKLLVKPCHALIMTSATLEVMGSFDFFSSRLGFEKRQAGFTKQTVSSPFDYSKVVVNAPLTEGDPNHAMHANEVKKYLLQAANRHKAQLVLFSSYKQMEQTYELLTPQQKESVLLQRSFSKSELLRVHKERIDNGRPSILFGTDSLSEGLDLQRQYLTCVLIAKLPFPNTNRPILKFEMQCLKALGGNEFLDFSLPMCARKLIQSAGRLIRSEDDYGEICILDPRINNKRYGKQLLHALPML